MSMKQLLATALLAAAASQASAAIVDADAFTVEYDDSTWFGFINSTGSGSGTRSFGWTNFPPDTFAGSDDGDATASFTLPTLTITAKSGWTLAEFLRGKAGGFFSESGFEALADVTISGSISIDGGATQSFGITATKNTLVNTSAFRFGTWTAEGQQNFGLAQQIVLSDITFTFIAEPTGGTAGIAGDQPGPTFEFGVVQAPVPEPGTYALMALGLLGVGAVARRRKTA